MQVYIYKVFDVMEIMIVVLRKYDMIKVINKLVSSE